MSDDAISLLWRVNNVGQRGCRWKGLVEAFHENLVLDIGTLLIVDIYTLVCISPL